MCMEILEWVAMEEIWSVNGKRTIGVRNFREDQLYMWLGGNTEVQETFGMNSQATYDCTVWYKVGKMLQ